MSRLCANWILPIWLSVALPLGALEIVPPFRPIGPVDPALLLAPGENAPPGMVVAGQVVGETGEPLPGAELLLHSGEATEEGEFLDESKVRTRPARSDESGFFAIPGIDPDVWADLEIRAPGFVDGYFELGLPRERRFGQLFQLEPAGGVRLEVVDDQGEPLPEAVVLPIAPGEFFFLGQYLLSPIVDLPQRSPNREGLVFFEGLSLGPKTLLLRHAGKRSRLISVDIEAGKRLDLGKVMLEKAPRLSGRVVDAAGQPIAKASIRLQVPIDGGDSPGMLAGAVLTADSDGRFELEADLPEDFIFVVLASAEGFGSQQKVLERAPLGEIRMVLGDRRRLHGQVLSAPDSRPLGDCKVLAMASGPSALWSQIEVAVTDAGGHFEITEAQAGSTTLMVACGERRKAFELEAEQSLPLLLELPSVTAVRGSVRFEEGDPARAVTLRLGYKTIEMQGEGHFAFEAVEPGERLLGAKSGDSSFELPLKVPAEGLTDLEVEIPSENRLGRIVGKVVDSRGRPLADAQITVFSGTEKASISRSSFDGSFQSGRLAPGTYKVIAEWQRRLEKQDVKAIEGTTRLELSFSAGARLRGKVEGMKVGEAGRLLVRATRPWPIPSFEGYTESVEAEVDAAGGFLFEEIPPGDWEISAVILGRRVEAKKKVRVEEEQIGELRLLLEELP